MSFQELKSEEHVLNLVFCLNYFEYSHSVGQWVSDKRSVGRWVGSRWVGGSVGRWSVVSVKPNSNSVLQYF